MTTAVESAVIAGFKAVRSVSGLTVSVTRDATTISVVAVPGDSLHQSQQDGVVLNEIRTRDFLILSSDYDFGSGAVEPERNDTITYGGTTYKVLADAGDVHFRYADPHHAVMRLHTKPT